MSKRTTNPYLEQIQDPAIKQAMRGVQEKLQYLDDHVKGKVQGTINPDQKPTTFGRGDIGTRFFSTDYARAYVFTGSGWADAPDAATRFAIGFFPGSPEPPIGWARCDGRNVFRSTNTGGVILFATPIVTDMNGQQAWVRL